MSAPAGSLAPRAPRAIRIVAVREFLAYFDSGIATASTIAALLLCNSIFMNEFFLIGRVDMAPFFERLPLLLVLFLPAQSMRMWAEERRSRMFEVLVTLPVSPLALVIGKFLAALALFGLFLAGTLPIVAMLASLGSPDLGLIASGYLAALLFGALLLSIGAVLSALTQDQVVAFVLTVLVSAALVLSGDERLVAILDGLAPALAAGTWIYETLSALPHYREVASGIVGLPSLAYFVGLTSVALALCAALVARQRA